MRLPLEPLRANGSICTFLGQKSPERMGTISDQKVWWRCLFFFRLLLHACAGGTELLRMSGCQRRKPKEPLSLSSSPWHLDPVLCGRYPGCVTLWSSKGNESHKTAGPILAQLLTNLWWQASHLAALTFIFLLHKMGVFQHKKSNEVKDRNSSLELASSLTNDYYSNPYSRQFWLIFTMVNMWVVPLRHNTRSAGRIKALEDWGQGREIKAPEGTQTQENQWIKDEADVVRVRLGYTAFSHLESKVDWTFRATIKNKLGQWVFDSSS